eukprot:160817_1
MKSYQLSLDGNTLTFDYDQPSISDKTNLLWSWSCNKKYDGNIIDCNHLFTESNSKQLILFDNEQFVVNNTYIYEIEMTVTDINIPTRIKCIDSVILIADIIPNTDSTDLINILSVSISAISKQIKVNERLRLFVDVTNWNDNGNIVTYNWTETTDLLQIKNINDINENAEDNGNLILSDNILSAGNIYEFELFVAEYNNNNEIIGYGSSSIQIYVNTK